MKPGTRSEALLAKTTKRPSALMDGSIDPAVPAATPPAFTLTSVAVSNRRVSSGSTNVGMDRRTEGRR